MADEERGDEEVLTEDDHLRNFFKEMIAVDHSMEPLREHQKALKANYVENKWLTRPQMSMVLRAYRAYKSELDLEELDEMLQMVKREIRRS